MPPIRFEIRKVMTWVAVIALNLGIFRVLYSTRRLNVLLGGGLIWVFLQVAAWRAVGRSHRARSYWLGVVGGGLLGSLSLIWSSTDRGSLVASIWNAYFYFVEGCIGRVVERLEPILRSAVLVEILDALLMAVDVIPPIALAAWLGGLLGRRIFDVVARRPQNADGTLTS